VRVTVDDELGRIYKESVMTSFIRPCIGIEDNHKISRIVRLRPETRTGDFLHSTLSFGLL